MEIPSGSSAAMDPESNLLLWVLLDRHVLVPDEITVDACRSECAVLRCDKRKAYGCGSDGDMIVDGLMLSVLVADPPGLSALYLHRSEDVARAKGPLICAEVLYADSNLIVLMVAFPCCSYSDCYLIYDAANASLTMFPHLSLSETHLSSLEPSLTDRPLPIYRDDGDFALVHMARYIDFEGEDYFFHRDLVCLWPPSPSLSSSSSQSSSQSSSSSSSGVAQWQHKTPIFPKEVPTPSLKGFAVQEAFSFDGKLFWANLLVGVLFCEIGDLLSDQCDHVPFCFMHLPPGCRPDPNCCDRDSSPEMYRTMACVGGSIKFVSIDGYIRSDPEDGKVKMWTLTPDLHEWRSDGDIRLGDLWEQEECKRARVPPLLPMNPILSAQEDGVLYMSVPDYYIGCDRLVHRNGHHMLRIDMSSKTLLSSTRIPSWRHLYSLPHIVGADFIQHDNLIPLDGMLKRKLPFSC